MKIKTQSQIIEELQEESGDAFDCVFKLPTHRLFDEDLRNKLHKWGYSLYVLDPRSYNNGGLDRAAKILGGKEKKVKGVALIIEE